MTTVQPMTILVVDDEEDVRNALRRSLRGQNVHFAANAREALEIMKTMKFDLVLSDNDMGEIPGVSFLQKVRILYPNVTRVLLTGRATINLAVRALNEKSAHCFLQKPWSNIDLPVTLALVHRRNSGILARATNFDHNQPA